MDSEKLFSWIQILTGIAVLMGLALVLWELQQARELARAQLASDGWAEVMSTQRAQLGETFATTMSKACNSPSELTDTEIQEAIVYHDILLNQIERRRGYDHIGEYQTSAESVARSNIGLWLSTKVGRADYMVRRESLNPADRMIAESIILNNEIYRCEEFDRRVFQLVRAEGDPILD